jgi:hypothetical protein
MAAKLTILTHKIAVQLHLVTESCTICSSRPRRPVPSYIVTYSTYTKMWVNVWLYNMNINVTCPVELVDTSYAGRHSFRDRDSEFLRVEV